MTEFETMLWKSVYLLNVTSEWTSSSYVNGVFLSRSEAEYYAINHLHLGLTEFTVSKQSLIEQVR